MAGPVSIEFHLAGSGWADMEFRIGSNTFVARSISYTTDALGDMLRAALLVATGASEAIVSFDREPAEWRVRLSSLFDPRSGLGQVEISVLELPDFYAHMPDGEGNEVFRASCDALEFARAILVLAKNSSAQFQKFAGDSDIPYAAMAALEAALATYPRKTQ